MAASITEGKVPKHEVKIQSHLCSLCGGRVADALLHFPKVGVVPGCELCFAAAEKAYWEADDVNWREYVEAERRAHGVADMQNRPYAR